MKKSKKRKADFLMEKIGARAKVSFEPGAGNYCLRIKEDIGGKIRERAAVQFSGDNFKKYYKVLGIAHGQDFMHCVYLGSKYAKIFDRSVEGYTIESSDRKGCVMKVTFYKLKKRV